MTDPLIVIRGYLMNDTLGLVCCSVAVFVIPVYKYCPNG